MKSVLLVFLGGGLGSAARYLIYRVLNQNAISFPYWTFTVNIVGSLIIGIVLGLALKNNVLSNNVVLFTVTGFCGGFTTFSAFAYENHLLLKSGDLFTFAAYTLGSVILGFSAVFVGIFIAKLFY